MQKNGNRVGVHDHFSSVLMANELICRSTICHEYDDRKGADFSGKLGVEAGEQTVLF